MRRTSGAPTPEPRRFAALAAEAYVNEFLATMLDSGDFRAVDRLPTVEKYVVG